ncbi:hypothetical protein ACFX13_026151 [Malus domestica]
MSTEKKPKSHFATREGSSAAPKLVIDLISSKSEKEEAVKSVLVAPAAPRATSSIADRIAQGKSSSVPPVPKFVQNIRLGLSLVYLWEDLLL